VSAGGSKRLALLEKMTAGGSTDPFHWYGLALEYQGAARDDDALRTFEKLRELHGAYVPQYLMHGQLLVKLGRKDDAKGCYEAGIAAAKKKGDDHALSELERELGNL